MAFERFILNLACQCNTFVKTFLTEVQHERDSDDEGAGDHSQAGA